MGKNFATWPIVLVSALLPLLLLYNNCSSESSRQSSSSNGPNDLGSNGNGGDGNGIPGSTNPSAGKAFFTNTIVPTLDSYCKGCHNQPRFIPQGTQAGPLTIYDYGPMGIWLANGPSSFNNFLINKIRNIEPHAGGDLCLSGIDQSPCLEVIQWRETEIPGSTGGGSGAIGNLTFVSVLGNVSGWAKDGNDPNAIVKVFVYVDGRAGQGGTKVGEYLANGFGIGGTNAGHYFSFELPPQFANGVQRGLYIYAGGEAEANLLPGAPRNYIAYSPTVAGQNYFAQNIQGQLNCGSCHSWDYTTALGSLLSPTPNEGGTATTNNFYRFSNGQNNHPGGNVCNGRTLCNNIQQWWNTEFN